MKNVLVLYPNQLFDLNKLPKEVDKVLMVEDPLYFGTSPNNQLYMHKQKLVLHRSSMRRYTEEVLWPAGYQVEYVEFNHLQDSGDIVNYVSEYEQILLFDPVNETLVSLLRQAFSGLTSEPNIVMMDSPNYFLTRQEINEFLAQKNKSDFKKFYQWQRERFNILIDPKTYKPTGGKLSFEGETKKRLAKDQQPPSFQVFGSNKYVEEAKKYVQNHFTENPGSLDDFPWPTSHEEANSWLDEFLDTRLSDYSVYEDALDGQAPWLYHSGLSPLLNIGILDPKDVVQKALNANESKQYDIASLESFIRQIIGWREYMRGIYHKKHVHLITSNTFGHNRSITVDWYRGTTGLPPVDDVVQKVITRAYAHHTERLMVLGSVLFLCDFSPDDVYRYFSEMFIDAYDWTVIPNVFGMSQFTDDDNITSIPYISSSNFILKMSHYEKGEWCDVWDGLYWRFIDKNRDRLKKNAQLAKAVKQLDKMGENKRRVISYRAEDFLKEKTAP